MKNRYPTRIMVLFVSCFLATIFLVACNQSQPAAPTAQESKAAAPQGVVVHLVFEGPWAFAPDPKDANSIIALAPKTKRHRDLFVQTWDKTLASGVYDLSFPPRVGSPAGTVDPNILRAKIEPATVQRVLDTKLERYAIRLPKPDAYVPAVHYGSSVGPTYPPDPSTEKDYVTVVSLRYNLTTLTGFSLGGTPDSGTFSPLLMQVETPVINFTIAPSRDADPADKCDVHTRGSFNDLVKLLGLTLFIDFPREPATCHAKDPQNMHPAKAALDGQSLLGEALALLDRDSPGMLRQQLLAAAFFFGAQASNCHGPIIVGGEGG